MDMGRKFGRGALPLFGEGELGPHLAQCRLARGLPPYQVALYRVHAYRCSDNRYSDNRCSDNRCSDNRYSDNRAVGYRPN